MAKDNEQYARQQELARAFEKTVAAREKIIADKVQTIASQMKLTNKNLLQFLRPFLFRLLRPENTKNLLSFSKKKCRGFSAPSCRIAFGMHSYKLPITFGTILAVYPIAVVAIDLIAIYAMCTGWKVFW